MRLIRQRRPLSDVAAVVSMMGLLTMIAGCGTSQPKYQWIDDDAALAALRRQARAVQTVQGTCTITMRQSNGRHIVLDGALVAKNPDSLRLRAWKLHHPAFDFTATPKGQWIQAPPDSAVSSMLAGDELVAAWRLVNGSFMQRDLVLTTSQRKAGQASFVERNPSDEAAIECVVDRRSLTPRRYEVRRRDGTALGVIRLDRYRQTDSIVWPYRITLEHRDGRLTIEFEDVEFNSEPAANAFTPPRHAVMRP